MIPLNRSVILLRALNFKWLFLNLNRVICNYIGAGSPCSLKETIRIQQALPPLLYYILNGKKSNGVSDYPSRLTYYKVHGAKTNTYKRLSMVNTLFFILNLFFVVQECPGPRSDGFRCHWGRLKFPPRTQRRGRFKQGQPPRQKIHIFWTRPKCHVPIPLTQGLVPTWMGVPHFVLCKDGCQRTGGSNIHKKEMCQLESSSDRISRSHWVH